MEKKCNVFQCQKCYLEFLDKKFVKKFLTHSYYRKEYVKLYDKKFFLIKTITIVKFIRKLVNSQKIKKY